MNVSDIVSEIGKRLLGKPSDPEPGAISLQARAAGEPRTFSAMVYSGDSLSPRVVKGLSEPIVVDLSGLKEAHAIPINLDHDQERRVGHVTRVINDGRSLRVEGAVSARSTSAAEFERAADSNYPWQCSIEVQIKRAERIPPGEVVFVNGRQFRGPLIVARESELGGVAFLARGADRGTQVNLAAGCGLEDCASDPAAYDGYACALLAARLSGNLDALRSDEFFDVMLAAGVSAERFAENLNFVCRMRRSDAHRILENHFAMKGDR